MNYINTGADISADGKYRYRLWREWRDPFRKEYLWWWLTDENGKPAVDGAGSPLGEPLSCTFIMLNPSTADGTTDDATIRRCVGFANYWGFDRLDILNLFAYRTSKPSELLALDHHDDAVGTNNKYTFDRLMGTTPQPGMIVCAWGAHGGWLGQNETVLGWLGETKLHCLGTTKFGMPKHPLYLPADTVPVEFRP